MRILVFGTFDALHPGHRFLLAEALKRGDLTVIVARDANVLRIKGRSPQQPEEERRAAVQEAFPAAEVILGDLEDFLVPVRAYKPDLILLGYDQELPPGVTMEDLPCPMERLSAHEPGKYKSSLMREPGTGNREQGTE
ncbi:MAG: adenylyltransferase/cytidyltransferase family protein [Candidatus Peregrinibacteria bacterium]|nr:adenylyltransferase/cytidyltransferase family protein [Candidatus Peregrinibacteria bacterium]